jgi:hypothetical protein
MLDVMMESTGGTGGGRGGGGGGGGGGMGGDDMGMRGSMAVVSAARAMDKMWALVDHCVQAIDDSLQMYPGLLWVRTDCF